MCAVGVEDFDTLVKFDLMLHSTENNGPHFYSDAANEEKWFKVPKGQIQYLVPLVVLPTSSPKESTEVHESGSETD